MPTWRYPRLIAHRCGGALAPENTLAGLRIAARLGVKAVEFDAMLSRDGVPVLVHDETLERTTNGRGRVAETSAADLGALDAGVRHHRAYAGEPVPTLAAALALCDELQLAVNLEIKPSAGQDVLTGHAVTALAGARVPRAGLILSSFSAVALAAAAEMAPELSRALLVETLPADWAQQLRQQGCIALHAEAQTLDHDLARAVVAAGVPLACYTVNRRCEADALFALGVAAVFSDRPDLFT
ncbi:MAG TPA: glycerophosphodiester phosphodiesterase [Rhodocyclaceae bacterium]|nr:glycerophosphodiester phosphodiesterase [Rhodocyclaceae bacterium]